MSASSASLTDDGDRELAIVLGAGRMGVQVGIEYALAGFTVHLVARDQEALADRVEDAVSRWSELLPSARGKVGEASGRLVMRDTWEGVEPPPSIVVESLPEDLALKVRLLTRLLESFPQTVVASNTSSLDITALGSEIGASDRTIGVHYLNPPFLNPLVEVTPGEGTLPSVTERMMRLVEAMGKRPILVRHALPGFIWNRLQFAVLREAVALVEAGVTDPADLDAIMELGLGRRWRATGPFKAAILGGVDTFVSAAPPILESLSTQSDLLSLSNIAASLFIDAAVEGRARDRMLAADLERASFFAE